MEVRSHVRKQVFDNVATIRTRIRGIPFDWRNKIGANFEAEQELTEPFRELFRVLANLDFDGASAFVAFWIGESGRVVGLSC